MNTLWFASLVLAIGAAMTGMLAMTWRSAVLYAYIPVLPVTCHRVNLPSLLVAQAQRDSFHGTSVSGCDQVI